MRRRVRETQDLINRAGGREGKSAANTAVQQEKKAADDTLGILRTVESGRQAFVQSRIESAEKETASIIGNVQKQASATVAAKKREDAVYKAAMADIKRLENERKRINEQTSRAIENQAKKEADTRIREGKRAASEILKQLRGIVSGTGGGGIGGRGGQGGGGAFFGGSLAGFAGAGPFVSAIGVGLGLTIFAVTARLKEGAVAWVEYSSKIENARIAFTTMLGSTQLADAHLRELQRFALTTPFAFDELVDASQRMQALGFAADEIVPVLNDVGNAVAAAGGGSERLDRVIKALSDVRAKEKLQTQEVRQFAEAGISVYKMLQEETGKSVVEIQKMIEAGEITSTVFENAFRKFSQAHFGDLMEKQAKTFTGAMSNVRDVLLQTAATAFEPFFKKISEIAVRTQEELQKAQNLDQVAEILSGALVEVGFDMAERIAEGIAKRLGDPKFWARYLTQLPRAIEVAAREAWENFTFENLKLAVPGAGIADTLLRPVPAGKPGPPPGSEVIPPISIPSLLSPLPRAASQEQIAKQSEKAVTILKDLQRQLIITGEASREMATRQKLLAEGISEVTNEAAKEAIELARAQDKLLQLLKTAEQRSDFNIRAAELEADRNFRIRKSLDDLLDPVGEVSQRLADLRAEQTGGRTEVEKFNAVLALQAATFLSMSEHELEMYRAKFAEIDRLQAENTIAKRIQELANEAFKLRESVDGNLPPLKEFELWVMQNAQAAKTGKDKLDALRAAFEQLAAATDADKIKRERQVLAKSLSDIGRDLEAQFQRKPDDAISQLAEDLQKLSFLKIQPLGFDEFIERLRTGALDAQQATSLIATSIAGAAGNIGPEFDKVIQQIVNLFLKSRDLSEFLAREDATAKYTQLVAELSLVLEIDAAKTHSVRLAKELLKDSYRALTDAQREHLVQLAAEADAAERAREAQERRLRQLQDVAQDLGRIFSDVTDAIGQGTEKFFDSLRRQVTDLASDIKEQLFTGLFEGLLTGEVRPGAGIGGMIADTILKGLGLQIGQSQEAVVADNTQATRDNTAALNANTRAVGGVPAVSGIPGIGDILNPFLNLLPKRAFGGGTKAGDLFRINDRFSGRQVELWRPSVDGQVLSLSEENAVFRQQQDSTVVENRTIVAFGNKAVNEAQEAYGRSRDGRRAQLVNARWHRKVLSFA